MTVITAPGLGQWISRGWRAFMDHSRPLIAASFILVGIYVILISFISTIPGTMIYWIFAFFLAPVLSVGWYQLSLKAARGRDPNIVDLFTVFSRYGRVWALAILVDLIFAVGFVLFIIPGIILAITFGGSLFAIVDGKNSILEALRFSLQISKGYRWHLFGMGLVSLFLSLPVAPFLLGLQLFNKTFILIGIIPFLLGVVILIPWIGTIYAAAYDSLAARYMAAKAPRPTT